MFTINIELGNEAMSRPEDVAEALRTVASKLYELEDVKIPIFDLNGNRVGTAETN